MDNGITILLSKGLKFIKPNICAPNLKQCDNRQLNLLRVNSHVQPHFVHDDVCLQAVTMVVMV